MPVDNAIKVSPTSVSRIILHNFASQECKTMKTIGALILATTFLLNIRTAMADTVTIRVVETSDVHGCFFPYDFINRKPKSGSLARVATYVDSLRRQYGDRLLLLENGDILQGQPTCYYCNYVNPGMPNAAAGVVNYLHYDVQNMGNHDIETGHAVYDKWIGELDCPVLGANILTKEGWESGDGVAETYPSLKPYVVLDRGGIRIVVLGLITPAIPNWLNEELWSGMRFEEMTRCARRMVKYIHENEHPDVLIGLFHSGREGGIVTADYEEDASLRVAREVPGFDLVLYGHDHTMHQDIVTDVNGHNVVCLDPSCNALYVSDAEITLTVADGKVVDKKVEGRLQCVEDLAVDEAFMRHFQPEIDSVNAYVDRKIGTFTKPVYTRDSYFGNSAFCDFIHNMQLRITGADVSFNAPLTFNTRIDAGDVRVSDMFNLYKYENLIYVMRMTGSEIRRHLEMSYDLWVTTMTSPDDHIMLIDEHTKDDKQRFGFRNLAFNFDSAAGIDYEVDVTKPDGQKVRILRMSNGEPFDEDKWYNVVMNSYRGNGGGELLTKGAGIAHDELESRIVYKSDLSQRHYLTVEIEKAGIVTPEPNSNWRFVPAEWAEPAIARDRLLLFGE